MKGLKYDKLKSELNNSDSWGSYSDLFMVLSFVFLMMYVVASLRSGTNSIRERLEKQTIARENEDLKSQMKAYETLKDAALAQESEDEQKIYSELMDKLSLLQEEAKEEKQKLRQQALENEKKEIALNRYQQVVRNIINANLLAKNKLKVREEIIDKKNEVIGDLNEDIEAKQKEIEDNNQKISEISNNLQKNIAKLQKAQIDSKISKENAYKEIALLKKRSEEEIQKLNQENKQVQSEVAKIAQELSETKTVVTQKVQENEKLNTDLARTSEQLEKTKEENKKQIQDLQRSHEARMAREKTEFEKHLKSAKLTAQEKAKQLEEFNNRVKAKDQAMARQLASLKSELDQTAAEAQAKAEENKELTGKLEETSKKLEKTVGQYENQIKKIQSSHEAKMAQEKAQFEDNLKRAKLSADEKAKQLAQFNQQVKEKEARVGKEIEELKNNLAEAQEKANARQKLSREIAQALKKAGIEADVNEKTGNVTITFDKDFFDNGSAELKPGMREILKKFIPKYSESLFKDKKIADKITSVEIVGFASPTYKGRYIDPNSLAPEDQKAAKFNLDLSISRATSIFDYMFDTKKITYDNQKKLLSLVKVSGRSFFSEGRAPAGVTPGMDQKKFCSMVDCKQAQKVIIKFNMDEK